MNRRKKVVAGLLGFLGLAVGFLGFAGAAERKRRASPATPATTATTGNVPAVAGIRWGGRLFTSADDLAILEAQRARGELTAADFESARVSLARTPGAGAWRDHVRRLFGTLEGMSPEAFLGIVRGENETAKRLSDLNATYHALTDTAGVISRAVTLEQPRLV